MLITICSYCSRYRDRLGNWQVHDGVLDPRNLTHGICEACYEDELRTIERVLGPKKRSRKAQKPTPGTNPEQTYELVM